jgi:hypothetical protein
MSSLYKKCVQLAHKTLENPVIDFPLFWQLVESSCFIFRKALTFPSFTPGFAPNRTHLLPTNFSQNQSVISQLSAVSTMPIMITITLYKEENK